MLVCRSIPLHPPCGLLARPAVWPAVVPRPAVLRLQVLVAGGHPREAAVVDVLVPAREEEDVGIGIAVAMPPFLCLPHLDPPVSILDDHPLGDCRPVLIMEVWRSGREGLWRFRVVDLLNDLQLRHPRELVVLLRVLLPGVLPVPVHLVKALPVIPRAPLVGAHLFLLGRSLLAPPCRGPGIFVNVECSWDGGRLWA